MVEKIRSNYYCRPRHRYEKSEEEKCEDDIVASGLEKIRNSKHVNRSNTVRWFTIRDDVLKKTGRYYRYETWTKNAKNKIKDSCQAERAI